jgi:hypothetical protein
MSDEQGREASIRRKAYELWEEAGRPAGDAVRFWLAAEAWYDMDREVEEAESESFPASDPPAH